MPEGVGNGERAIVFAGLFDCKFWNIEGGWILDIWMKGSQQA